MGTTMELEFITSNSVKMDAARRVLNKYGIKVRQRSLHLEEIQELDVRKVAQYKARYASNKAKDMFMVEDSGVKINALNGFPGALLKLTFETLGEDGILTLVKGRKRAASFINVAVLYEPKFECFKTFETVLRGRLAEGIRGNKIKGWSIDRIFIPNGWKKTVAEMSCMEYDRFWKETFANNHYDKLGRYLSRKQDLRL